jgi:hypothetical protein
MYGDDEPEPRITVWDEQTDDEWTVRNIEVESDNWTPVVKFSYTEMPEGWKKWAGLGMLPKALENLDIVVTDRDANTYGGTIDDVKFDVGITSNGDGHSVHLHVQTTLAPSGMQP